MMMSMPDDQPMRAEIYTVASSTTTREEQLFQDLLKANDRIAELERLLAEAYAQRA
jgi:hypothetical protein